MNYLTRRTMRLIAESGLPSAGSVPGAKLHSAYHWKYLKGGPILAKMAAILDALGYELEIVPKRKADEPDQEIS